MKSKKIVIFLIAVIGGVVLIQNIYLLAVSNNVFDDRHQHKYEEQLERGIPLIFSGRTEIYSSLAAIKDAPIFGHGSWAVNPKYTLIEFRAIGERVDNKFELERINKHRIPAHSFFLGTWAYSGLLAAVFFIFFGIILVRGFLFFLNFGYHHFTPAYMIFFPTFFWHLLFSPLGVDKRIYVGFLLAIGGGLWSMYQYQKKNKT